eukprot:7026360-Heterocapsa_arctica.AAC.1
MVKAQTSNFLCLETGRHRTKAKATMRSEVDIVLVEGSSSTPLQTFRGKSLFPDYVYVVYFDQ